MNEKTLVEICEKKGIIFVNRTYGKATTGPISLSLLKQIIEESVKNETFNIMSKMMADLIDKN